MNSNLGGASRAGQPDLWFFVRPDHRRVDVSVPVHLRTAEKSYFDAAILQKQLEDVGHSADHERTGHQRRIADGHGKALGRRTDRA